MVSAPEARRPAIFLDRDGVLVVPDIRDGRSFAPRRLEDFKLYPHAAAALARLKEAGYLLVVVTNQPDVGNGHVSPAIIEQMHEQMLKALPLDQIEVCFHTQTDECSCRKPKPGMLLKAAHDLAIDLDRSFMVGDRAGDVAAGKAAGCVTIFIDLDYASEQESQLPDYTVSSVVEAADIILGTIAKKQERL